MRIIDSFLKQIKKIQDKLGLNDLKEVELAGIFFCRFADQKVDEIIIDSSRDLSNRCGCGYLFKSLSTEKRRWLESGGLSYLTGDGYGAIFTENQTFLLRPKKRKISNKLHLFRHSKPHDILLRESLLVSPAALRIIDVLHRTRSEELEGLSGLSFAKKFGLSQPVLSRLMTSTGAASLRHLTRVIFAISSKWWIEAFNKVPAARRMTPFFRVSQQYRLPETDLSLKRSREWMEKLLEKYPGKVFLGPPEVAKALGALIDRTIYLWCDNSVLGEIKKDYRLIPCRSGEEPFCVVAVPKGSFEKEAIISAGQQLGDFPLPSSSMSLNLVRSAWDLYFGDSRLRESIKVVLEMLSHASK